MSTRIHAALMAALFGILLAAAPAALGQPQTIWYVDEDAPSDPGPGDPTISDPLEDGSPEHPFDAIQEGLDAAFSGDTVLVLNGEYTDVGNRNLDFGGRNIALRSESGPETCIIDCARSGRGFSFHTGESAAAIVDGFTITRGYIIDDYRGDGVYCASGCSPTIVNCIIESNQIAGGGYGAGIYCAGDVTVTNCRIINNQAWSLNGAAGGGIYCSEGTPAITNCVITENGADFGGGICVDVDSSPVITNCVTAENDSYYGGGICVDWGGSAVVTNCTIFDNAETGVDGWATLTNCILWDNGDGWASDQVSGVASVDYSCIQGWNGTMGGVGNIWSDPRLLDASLGVYRLLPDSPCADAGNNTAVPADAADLDDDGDTTERTPLDLGGLPRFVDDPLASDSGVADPPTYPEIVDMGAHEHEPTSAPLIMLLPTELTFCGHINGQNPDPQTLSLRNIGRDTLNWEVVESCPWLEVNPSSGASDGEYDEVTLSVDDAGLEAGWHECVVEVVDAGASNSPQSASVRLHVSSGLILVPSNFPTIQGAIDAAWQDDVVEVADGMYVGTGNKDLSFHGKAITVRSENGPENCIIDCQNNGRGFLFDNGESRDAIVDGLTITRGQGRYLHHEDGGGVYCAGASPTIINCRIIECRTLMIVVDPEGGVWEYGLGGGIYCYNGDPLIANCLIANNDAPASSGEGYGGGLFCGYSAAVEIVNCTIVGNTAHSGGGGVHCAGTVDTTTIANCILWDNQGGGTTEQQQLSGGPKTIDYSCVEGWTGDLGGVGNIGDDPLFAPPPDDDDYHLTSDSPCVDAGDNAAVPPGVITDLDGNPRFMDGDGDQVATVDMGVYEYQRDFCFGDLDGDDDVDLSDLATLLANYGITSGAVYEDGDLDADGDVDLSDLAALLAVYGTTCP